MEDYRIVELHGNKLKVYRNGRIEKYFVFKKGSKDRKFKKGDIKLIEIGSLDKSSGYIRYSLFNESIKKDFKIHRIIAYAFLGLDIDNPTEVIDHIDRNKLNNNVVNLRIVTQQQNLCNKSNIKGYSFVKITNNYRTQITVHRKHIHLGYYKTEICARYAYLTAKSHYHQF